MPLPTSLPETAEGAFARVVSTAQGVASNIAGVRSLIVNGGPIQMDNLIGLYQSLNGAQSLGRVLQGVEGLNEVAQQVVGDPSYDIRTDFTTSIIACRGVTDWLLANMPSDGAGGFTGWRHEADGSVVRLVVPVNDVVTLVPLLDAAAATFA